MSLKLNAKQQNARMGAERTVLTELLEAAVRGDFRTIQSTADNYISQNIDLSITDVVSQFKDAHKRTLIHFACQSPASSADSTDDIVEQILQWLPANGVGPVLRLKDKDGMTPLMIAAQHVDRLIAERRVLAIIRVDSNSRPSKLGLARSKTGATALHYAAGAGATKTTISALINAGKVALNAFSSGGGCPLHFACSSSVDQIETITELVEAGADINASTDKIPPPIFLALAAGNKQHANFLLNLNVSQSMEYVLQPGGVSIFHMVADMNFPFVLAKMLEKAIASSKMNLRNDEGYTPLDLAAKENHVGCVVLLLSAQKGSSVDEVEARIYIETWKNDNPISLQMSTVPANTPIQASASSTMDDEMKKQAEQEISRIKEIASNNRITEEQKQKATELKGNGNAHFVKKEWYEAIADYTTAIQVDPTDASFYANRSACYMQMRKPEKALYDAIIAHNLKPDWPKAAYRMAVAYLELEKYEEAALLAWEGLQQDQENEELKCLLQKCVNKGRKDFHTKKKKKNMNTPQQLL